MSKVGGTMASRVRDYDWSSIPLGPSDHWPRALRTAVGIYPHSTHPTAIYCGPELRLLYKDAWAPIPGDRHPHALGRPGAEVWPDIWTIVEGHVVVEWAIDPESLSFAFEWGEPGGPSISSPMRHGYGTRLIERGGVQEFGGEARIDFFAEGLVRRIRAPLSQKVMAQ